jgi:hypothetical protein
MGLKRNAGQGSFIDSVMGTTKDFYGEVVQGLRAWKAPPPKLKKPVEDEKAEQIEDLPSSVEEAVERAQGEMQSAASEKTTTDPLRLRGVLESPVL